MRILAQRLTAALVLAFALGSALAAHHSSTTDWAEVGATARDKELPLVVVITGDDCGHCERLRREFLTDPATRRLLDALAVTREIDRSAGGKITDFDGERLRARFLFRRYDVFAIPTVLFLDADGKPLVPSLVGYNDPVSYRYLVAKRLIAAQAILAARKAEKPAHLSRAEQ